MTSQTKATEQYFPVVLLIKLCKVVLFSESVSELKMLTGDQPNERYCQVLSCCTVY